MRTIALVVSLSLLASCVSERMTLPSLPLRSDEVVIGEAHGKATGMMLFQVIPIGQNDRFKAALGDAMRNGGSTRMIDVEVWESWFWIPFVGDFFTFHIKGKTVATKAP